MSIKKRLICQKNLKIINNISNNYKKKAKIMTRMNSIKKLAVYALQ